MRKLLKTNNNLKEELISILIKIGALWSYDSVKIKNNLPDNIIIENTLKYADLPEILLLFKIYDKNHIKKVWEKTMKFDTRFIKLNYYIGRVLFNFDIEEEALLKESYEKRYRFKNITF